MNVPPETFYSSVLAAGAILAGFCGTFLSFRIQREAGYYRQPTITVRADGEPEGVDVYIGLSHFTHSFLLLGLATLFSLVFGVAIPLVVLGGSTWVPSSPRVVVGGLLIGVVLLVGYFVCELIHYEILTSELLNDLREKRRERWVLWATFGAAVIAAALARFW